MSVRLIQEIRAKRPALAKRAENGSKSAAIRLFCLECMGGSPYDVRACKTRECPLFWYRMPGKKWREAEEDAGSAED